MVSFWTCHQLIKIKLIWVYLIKRQTPVALTALENVVYQMKTVTRNEVDDGDEDKLVEIGVFLRACHLGAEERVQWVRVLALHMRKLGSIITVAYSPLSPARTDP